jgi:uncharacterized protein
MKKPHFYTRVLSLIAILSQRNDKRIFFAEREFYIIIHDILSNEHFQKLKKFFHHNSSIYDHSLSVAYISYKIARTLSLDYTSVARGALLHDFYLYNWRENKYPGKLQGLKHGRRHPKVALANARTHFKLNKIEEDIIVKHMWPLTFSVPRFRESFVVTVADKYCASKEYSVRFQHTLKRRRMLNISDGLHVQLSEPRKGRVRHLIKKGKHIIKKRISRKYRNSLVLKISA